jgi:hypothetical protein
MSKLNDFKDALSKMATGMTKSEAHQKGVCINCKLPNVLSRCYSDAGRREYQISGMCEKCFDELFTESEVAENEG